MEFPTETRIPGIYLERYPKLASGSYSSVFRGIVVDEHSDECHAVKQSVPYSDEHSDECHAVKQSVSYSDEHSDECQVERPGAIRMIAVKQSVLYSDDDKVGTRWLHNLRNVMIGSVAAAEALGASSGLMPMERASLKHLGGSTFLLTWVEPLGGYTLGERSSACRRRWDEALLARYLSDVADSLRYLHEEVFGRGKGGHWDVKPDNVVILWDSELGRSRATLLDFGMSRSVLGTRPRTVCSLPYRPPERLYGGEYAEVGSAVDAWSLGMTALDSVTRAIDNMFAPPVEMFDPVKTDLDMAVSVASLLGAPDEESWPSFYDTICKFPLGREACYWDIVNDEGASESMLVFAPLEAELRRAETFRGDPDFARWVKSLLVYDPLQRDTSFTGMAAAAADASSSAAAAGWHPPDRFILCERALERLDDFEWNELDRTPCERDSCDHTRRLVLDALLSVSEWTVDFVGACVLYMGLGQSEDITFASAQILASAMFDDVIPRRFRRVSCVRPSLELARLVGRRCLVKDWIHTTELVFRARPKDPLFAIHLLVRSVGECLNLITPVYAIMGIE